MSEDRRARRWRHTGFAAVAVVVSALVAAALLAAIDGALHRRYARSAGLNVWGYRGPVVGRKAPGARRIVVLGGSTTFGYGVTHEHSMPALLQQAVRDRAAREGFGAVDVVNLGYNNEGAFALRPNLEDYRHLDYDVAVFYTGYNDLGGPNTTVFRRTSPIFRLTGYMPILPVVLAEKAMQLRYGTVDDAYHGDRVVFRPNQLRQTGAAALEAAATVARSLERQLGRLSDRHAVLPPGDGPGGCPPRWQTYCVSVVSAAEYALAQGTKVLIVGQPSISDLHIEQQASLASMLRRRFGNDPRLRVVDLGRTIDLRDRTLSFDGMHLSVEGNRKVADALVPAVLPLLR